MGLKANLRVKLYADDNFVAEIDNAPLMLWQQLLAHSEGVPRVDAPAAATPAPATFPKQPQPQQPPLDNIEVDVKHVPEHSPQQSASAISKLAEDIGVSEDAVVSAFDPIDTAPYIALEHKYWEAFRNNVTTKGRGAVSAAAVAATLLALWKFHSKKSFAVDVSLVNKVLDKVSADTTNTSRSLNRSEWLKVRQDGEVVIIPDNAKKARAMAKVFCTKQTVPDASNT